jgi:hypothetical protein
MSEDALSAASTTPSLTLIKSAIVNRFLSEPASIGRKAMAVLLTLIYLGVHLCVPSLESPSGALFESGRG